MNEGLLRREVVERRAELQADRAVDGFRLDWRQAFDRLDTAPDRSAAHQRQVPEPLIVGNDDAEPRLFDHDLRRNVVRPAFQSDPERLLDRDYGALALQPIANDDVGIEFQVEKDCEREPRRNRPGSGSAAR